MKEKYLILDKEWDNYYLKDDDTMVTKQYIDENNIDEETDEPYEQFELCDCIEVIWESEYHYNDRTTYYLTTGSVCGDSIYMKVHAYSNGTYANFIEEEEFFSALSEDEKAEMEAYIVAKKLAK